MKKNILNLMIILSFTILLIEVFIHKILIHNTINYSINLWLTALLPTMFPTFIITDILIHYNITEYIPKKLKKGLKYLFNISENATTIFLLSTISGFPSNARNTKTYYEKGLITKKEAEHILTITHFSNPIFILSTVGCIFLKNKKLGIIILLSHYLGNILIGILTRKNNTPSKNYTLPNKQSQKFSKILIQSISSSIDTLLLILGTLTSFLIVASLIIENLKLSPYPSTITKGILEITMGLKELSLLNLSPLYQTIISTSIISFGGLSVHLQIISQIADTDISYTPFFQARIFHALISIPITLILYFIL